MGLSGNNFGNNEENMITLGQGLGKLSNLKYLRLAL